MKKRLTALGLVLGLILLSGCSVQLFKYPRVPRAAPEPAETLTLALPVHADEALRTAVSTLQEKAEELSGGTLAFSVLSVEEPTESAKKQEADLYFFTNQEMIEMDSRFTFSVMPFLFSSADSFLTFINSDTGVVRNSPVTRSRLGGSVLGALYDGSWGFLGRSRFHDEIGLYESSAVLDQISGIELYYEAGSELVVPCSDLNQIFQLLTSAQVRYGEFRLSSPVPSQVVTRIRSAEPTRHRFDAWWIVLLDHAELSASHQAVLRDAISYLFSGVRASMEEQENWLLNDLRQQIDQYVENTYDNTRRQAVKFYKESWELIGIPSDIWRDLSALCI